MPLSSKYTVDARFQRAARIDADYGEERSLSGYVLHESAWNTLHRVAAAIEAHQGAFTWTGPYGSGKSSLAVLLSSFLSPDKAVRTRAERILGSKRTKELRQAFPVGSKGWVIVHVVGQRSDPIPLIAQALAAAIDARWPKRKPGTLGEVPVSQDGRQLVSKLLETAICAQKDGDGLLVVVDELGKFLEYAADTSGDLHIFQDLAEGFSRAQSSAIFLGILHQAFSEYGSSLSRVARDEWSKIQGRFLDIPFSVATDEIVGLIAKAIDGPPPGPAIRERCLTIAAAVNRTAPNGREAAPDRLAECWPLHPLTALLLGPISRRRFGQNERSVFSLLASAEPGGFREFLEKEEGDSLAAFGPEQLWDYLQLNLESTILASPDGHKWAEAAEAVERAYERGGGAHATVAKAIALLDVFGRQFSLRASQELLTSAWEPIIPASRVESVLKELQEWSIAVYRQHLGAWGVFAGSDIDLDAAITSYKGRLNVVAPELLDELPALLPVVAKRTYHRTGTQRWFSVHLKFSEEAEAELDAWNPADSEAGRIVLLVPGRNGSVPHVRKVCRDLAREAGQRRMPIAFGTAAETRQVIDGALELTALKGVREHLPTLDGDAVARRELQGRTSAAVSTLAVAVRSALESAEWHVWGRKYKVRGGEGLSRLASDLADQVYDQSPVIHNELINRDQASSNAVAARRALMYRMAENAGEERLGISGYPAEYGLYVSILAKTRLHEPEARHTDTWRFVVPSERGPAAPLHNLWQVADEVIDARTDGPVSFAEIYDAWRRPPIGLRLGTMPILALAFVLSREEELAVYIDGMFTPRTDDYFVDRLLQRPGEVAVRRFRVAGIRRSALQSLARFVVGAFDQVEPSAPLEVARPLVHFVHGLHPWAKRTKRLSSETVAVRDAILRANDPYALLFIELPTACGLAGSLEERTDEGIVQAFLERLERAVAELRTAYPALLDQMQQNLLAALGHSDDSELGLEKLRQRAERVIGLSGDFRLDAFARRIQAVKEEENWIEGICSLAANKPARDWSDPDIDLAKMEIADLGSRFRRVEHYAIAAAHDPSAYSVSLAIGEGKVLREYAQALILDDAAKEEALRVASHLREELRAWAPDSQVALAAALRIVDRLLADEVNRSQVSKHRDSAGD